jgi:hypothetical protein
MARDESAADMGCSSILLLLQSLFRTLYLQGLASMFDLEVRVPADQITATVSTRARKTAIEGTAGRKRRRL